MDTANGSMRREAVALALAKGMTIADASRDTGVGERTIYNWRQEADFKARVQEARRELFDAASGRLSDLGGKAASRLGELVESDNDAVALGACRTVLEYGLRLREVLDLEGRIAALEADRQNRGRR